MFKTLIIVGFTILVVGVSFVLGILFRPPIPWCPFCQRMIREGTPGEHFLRCDDFVLFCESVKAAITHREQHPPPPRPPQWLDPGR